EDLPERSESAPLGHRSRRRAQRAVARAEIPEHAGPSHHRPAGQADRLTPQPGRETTEKVALDPGDMIEVRLLGGFAVLSDGSSVRFRSRKYAGLLAYLVTNAGR